ncbi:hypothetical protein LCGC14_0395670 [marine sediment metagenome]|uniref:Uncharacterized protein n=1 Tax=marine sediment metagenome TaxID=412755 RepID=A0A0F9VKG3_9ZZZZ
MKRSKHITWCKQRAQKYIDSGELSTAFISMNSDLNKHKETKGHVGIELGMMLLVTGKLNTAVEMQKFIDGFN